MRHLRADGEVLVDPDRTGLELAGRALGAEDVSRPRGGGESVAGVVGQREGLVVAGEAENREHGPEDLLLDDLAGPGRTGDDGRGIEGTWPVERRAAALGGRTRVHGALDEA